MGRAACSLSVPIPTLDVVQKLGFKATPSTILTVGGRYSRFDCGAEVAGMSAGVSQYFAGGMLSYRLTGSRLNGKGRSFGHLASFKLNDPGGGHGSLSCGSAPEAGGTMKSSSPELTTAATEASRSSAVSHLARACRLTSGVIAPGTTSHSENTAEPASRSGSRSLAKPLSRGARRESFACVSPISPKPTLGFGPFLTAAVKFLILAIVIFLLVKVTHRALGRRPGDETAGVVLPLREIQLC